MFIKENRISMLFYLLKRKSMKITNRHRHITKSEYQPGIAMQAHDTTLLTLEDTTGNTDFLLFLKIILQRAIHQFDVWGIERSVFFNGREKWAKDFENQRV